MAIPVTNLNPLPPPVPPAATPPSTAPTGLFQATLANVAAQQITTPPLLSYLEDTGQLATVEQEDFPNPPPTANTTTTNTTANATNQASSSSSLAAQLGDVTTNSNVNENGTTDALYVVEFRFPGLIQENLKPQANPTTGTGIASTGSTATTATGTLGLVEQSRLQVAGTTRSGTTPTGATTTQATGLQTAPAMPTVPPAAPASTQPATEGVPIPAAASSPTGTNPAAAAALAAQQQVIPAQIPIVTGLATGTQTPTQLALATPEAVPAPVATAALPSAQTGERPTLAGDRLAMIAQEGANLRPAQVQSSGTFQSLLAQAVPGTGTAPSSTPSGTTSVAGAPTRIVATGASLTALSAQPSASTVAASTGPTAPTSSVPVAGEVGGPQAPSSPLQVVTTEAVGQHAGIIAAVAASGASQATAQISGSAIENSAAAASLLANAPTPGTVPSSAGPTAPNAVAPTLASQVADGVITHAQAVNQNGTTEFRMQLDPPELGTVNVHLVSTGDEVRGHVVVASDSVRQMIESQLPELRQRLEAAGVTVQNFNVTTDPSGGGNRNARQEPTPDSPTPVPTTPSTTTATRFRTNTTLRGGQVDVVV